MNCGEHRVAEQASQKPILDALSGRVPSRVPVWLMRQAGRYLPEYREVRARAGSFLDLCYTPARAAEVSLQPVRRFALDAAIIFSDILVVPDALGRPVDFRAGEGPVLEPIECAAQIPAFDRGAFLERLQPVYEVVRRVGADVPSGVAVLGFAGAPWTVATYMVEGGSSRDFGRIKTWAYREPEDFTRLIDILCEATSAHLIAQIDAGAEAVQIFDSWAGVLSEDDLTRWCIMPIARIVEQVRRVHPHAAIIGFPRGIGASYARFVRETGVDAVSLDTGVPRAWAVQHLQSAGALQGNLDPMALVAGGPIMRAAAERILEAFGHRPFVFNLGHGIVPQTPPEHVAALCDFVHDWRRPAA